MAITGNSIDLVWTAATDNIAVTDYKIYKSDDGVTYDSGTSVGNVLSYTYTGLTADTQYWFKITALDAAANESNFSNIVTDTTLPFLLDAYTGAAAAYSLRKLRTGETYAVEVRRSSDNATTDVELYNDGSSIDLSSTVSAGGTLGTWVGSNSAYVRTWYDQSGNSFDISQTTNTNQPRIINAGSIETVNSESSIKFDGINDGLINSSSVLASNAANTVAMVSKHDVIVNYTSILFAHNVARLLTASQSTYKDLTIVNTSGVVGRYVNSTIPNLDQNLMFIAWDGSGLTNSDYVVSINSNVETLQTSDSAGSPGSTFGLGYRSDNNTNYLNGYIQETIIWGSDQSSNRTAIETNINNHYSIF